MKPTLTFGADLFVRFMVLRSFKLNFLLIEKIKKNKYKNFNILL